jgi:hypothetical protein
MPSLDLCDENGVIGTITLLGGTLSGDNAAAESIVRARLHKMSPAAAFRSLATYNNGYIWMAPHPAQPALGEGTGGIAGADSISGQMRDLPCHHLVR